MHREYLLHDDIFYESYEVKDHDDPYYFDNSCLGSFQVEDYIDEEAIGSFKDNGKKSGSNIEVWVYGNEGDAIPHLHFISKKLHLDGCVKLENAEYFKHGKHIDTLTNKQAKAFHDFMQSLDEDGLTNYKAACTIWRRSDHNVIKSAEILNMPEYFRLNDNAYYRITIENKDIYAYLEEIMSDNNWQKFAKKHKHFDDLDIQSSYKRISVERYFKKEGVDIFNKYIKDDIKDLTQKHIEIKEYIVKDKPQYSDPYMIIMK